MTTSAFLAHHPETEHPVERARYSTLLGTLASLRHHFRGKRVLDFGASHGLSMCVLLDLGAESVVGVEPDEPRVIDGQSVVAPYGERADLMYVPDTRAMPFEDSEFGFILCNAVLEHIPQPRDAYLREMWRVLAPGGVLVANETPNKYLPADFHTLHLPLTNWLPSELAHWIGVRTGRFRAERTDWRHSGWRGIGFYEMVRPLAGWELIPENGSARHRALTRLGLPASLADPYPCWILRKH